MEAKEKKKYIGIVMLAIVVLMLCGCSGGTKMTVDTFLEIDENFKGQRSMSAIVSQSIFNQVFDGNLEELQKLVTKQCPSTLICKAEKVDKGIKITMTMEFANLQDYTDKVGQILGRTPGIYFDVSKSIFKSGYMIQENFSSADLFGWLLEVLKSEYPQLQDKTMEDLFENGKTSVIYKGEIIETTPVINVEKMESHTFDTLSVELTLNGNDSYGVTVNFIADKDVYYDMGDEMDRAIKRLVPDGGIYEVSNVDQQRIYTISFSAHNVETLLFQLNSVLKTKDCSFKVEDMGDESDPFKANKIITMYLDGSYFLDFGKEGTELVYKINANPEFSFNNCESVTGFLKDCTYNSDEHYSSVLMHVGPSDEVRLSLSYAIDLQKIDIHTKVINENKLERQIIFMLDSDKAKLIGETFKNKLTSRMADEMKLDVKESSGIVTYIVSMPQGDADVISKMTTDFFGSTSDDEMTSIISGGKNSREKLKKITYEFEDKIDLQHFLGKASIDEGIEYQIEYPKGYTVSLNDDSHTNTTVKDNVLKCETKNSMITVKTKGETSNKAGMTQLVIWWISFILTIFSLVVNIRHIIGFIRNGAGYLMDKDMFNGRGAVFMTIGIVSLTVFLFTSLRLIFRIY